MPCHPYPPVGHLTFHAKWTTNTNTMSIISSVTKNPMLINVISLFYSVHIRSARFACIIASLLITLTKLILSLAELLDRQMTHCGPFHEQQSLDNLAEFGVQPASLSALVYQAILEVGVHHGLFVHRISLCVCSRTKQAWIISSYTRLRRFQRALKDVVSNHQHPQRHLHRRLPYLWQLRCQSIGPLL